MSRYDLYRTRMRNEDCCRLKYEASFIEEGTSATTIWHARLNAQKQAGLILSAAEGPDSATVFTYKDEVNKNNELLKADYFMWENKTYFVYEDVFLVLPAVYKKQLAYQCNVECEIEGEKVQGYFISSLKKAVDQGLDKEISLADKERPMLIIPTFNWSRVGAILVINDKPWRITEVDYTTNAGISYCSLELGWISKSDDIIETFDDEAILVANKEYVFNTEEAYFAASASVNIIDLQENKVQFIVPFGVEELRLEIKKKGAICSKTYKVVVG